MGLADVIARRLYDKIDLEVTGENIRTSTFLERGKIPVVADSDRQAFDIALRSCGIINEGDERVICIKNTLDLKDVYVSPAVCREISNHSHIERLPGDHTMFNQAGALDLFST